MKTREVVIALTVILCFVLCACGQRKPHYVIGVSQCSDDIWRDKMNGELRIATYAHDNVELKFASANDNVSRQIEQIDRFADMGVDLLIVSPVQGEVSKAIDRAYDKGIPVIVFDRRTPSNKYTAYIGADNEEMGRNIARFLASQTNGNARIIEICGLQSSSPAKDRQSGFDQEIGRHGNLTIVELLQSDWTEEPTNRWTLCFQQTILPSTSSMPTTTAWQRER